VITPVTVIGGAGRIGGLVVDGLLAEGAQARVVSRRAHRGADASGRGAQFFNGDVRIAPSLEEPLRGTRAVVFSVEPGTANRGPDRPEATMYQGVINVLKYCGPWIERFVLVSQIYVTRSEHSMNNYGRLLDWRLRGEDEVRASGLPYTIVRPGWLGDERGGAGLRLEQGDEGDGRVARADVAAACLNALVEPAAVGKTFEIFGDPGRGPEPWAERFAALAADPAAR
jgi:uncharacterized protein YbjT (DUF2867 family)